VPQGYKSKYATRRYENLQLGVRLDYPTNLAVHEKVMGAIVSFVEELPGEEFGSHVNFVSHRLEDMNLSGDLEQFAETIKQQMPSFVQDYAIEDESANYAGRSDRASASSIADACSRSRPSLRSFSRSRTDARSF
jgi:hypothetical protein